MFSKKRLSEIHRTPAVSESRMDKIRMDKNEYIPCIPEKIFRDMISRIRPEHISAHPETGILYEKLAEKLGTSPENILFGAGSDALIKTAFEAFTNPEHKVLMTVPSFAMYMIYSDCYGIIPDTVHYDANMNLRINDILEKIESRPDMLLIANPNSPTGTVIDRPGLEKIIRKADSYGITVFIDEAYYPFYDDTIIDLLPETKNLIVSRTFSKAAGLAGMRVGYAVSSKEKIRAMTALKLMYEITGISALFAEYMIDNDELIFEYAKEVRSTKKELADFLEEKGFYVYQGHANFISVDFFERKKDIVEKLLAQNILFKEKFDHISMRRFCRFSIGDRDSTKQFMKIFEKLIQ